MKIVPVKSKEFVSVVEFSSAIIYEGGKHSGKNINRPDSHWKCIGIMFNLVNSSLIWKTEMKYTCMHSIYQLV